MLANKKNTSVSTDFSNENGDVFYDEQTDCICLILKGYSESSFYRALLDKAIELMARYNTCKMLGDTSRCEIIAVEDQDWTNSNWAKRAIEAGLRYNAIVLSEDIFGRLSIEAITEDAKVVKVKYFDNIAEAKEWLKVITQ